MTQSMLVQSWCVDQSQQITFWTCCMGITMSSILSSKPTALAASCLIERVPWRSNVVRYRQPAHVLHSLKCIVNLSLCPYEHKDIKARRSIWTWIFGRRMTKLQSHETFTMQVNVGRYAMIMVISHHRLLNLGLRRDSSIGCSNWVSMLLGALENRWCDSGNLLAPNSTTVRRRGTVAEASQVQGSWGSHVGFLFNPSICLIHFYPFFFWSLVHPGRERPKNEQSKYLRWDVHLIFAIFGSINPWSYWLGIGFHPAAHNNLEASVNTMSAYKLSLTNITQCC